MLKIEIHPMGGAPELWVGSISSPEEGIGYCVSGSKEYVLDHYTSEFPFLEIEDISQLYREMGLEGDRLASEMVADKLHEAELNKEYLRFLEERDRQK